MSEEKESVKVTKLQAVRKRCPKCGFRIRGDHHGEGQHCKIGNNRSAQVGNTYGR